MSKIRGILFDYGGTLDSRAEHWSEIIWEGYCHVGLQVKREDFLEVYVYVERLLGRESIVKRDFNFLDLMQTKIWLQLSRLRESFGYNENIQGFANSIARYCYDSAKECVEESKKMLKLLKGKCKLGVVSNFYGNLKAVMADFGILDYFDCVIESAIVGIRKPNSDIFQLGVNALNLNANETLVVGDSYEKDIVPSLQIGCDVIWYKGKGWGIDSENGISVKNVNKMEELVSAVLTNIS